MATLLNKTDFNFFHAKFLVENRKSTVFVEKVKRSNYFSAKMFSIDNDDNDNDDLLCQALFVEPGDSDAEDELQPASTAQDYLKRVVRETQQIPKVAVAPNSAKLLSVGATPRAPTHVVRNKAEVNTNILPPQQWKDEQISEFVMLRQTVERKLSQIVDPENVVKIPSKASERAWAVFCYGHDFWTKVEEARKALESSDDDDESKNSAKKRKPTKFKQENPTAQVLCQLRPTEVENLIEYQVEWADLLGVTLPEQGLWIYSLLARLEMPVMPDVISSLRSLVVICSKDRSRVASQSPELNFDEGMLVHLNLLITLITKYFGQSDIAD